jgi:hypothetical protein
MAEEASQNPENYRKSKYVIPNNQNNTRRNFSDAKTKKLNNDWQYLQNNNPKPNASSDEIFNSSYQRQGLQPRGIGQGIQSTGSAMKYGGVAMEAAGKTMEIGGNAMMRAGSALSSTGAGAVAGVPIAIAGGAIRGTGTGTKVIGRNLRRSGTTVNKAGKIVGKTIAKSKVSANTTAIFTWYGNVWLFAQLPLSIIGLLGLALFFMAEDSVLVSTMTWLAGWDDLGISIFILTYAINFVIGVFSFLIMYMEYTMSLIKSLSGNKDSLKTGAIVIALLGYATPIANIFPWLFIWVAVVWKYPE